MKRISINQLISIYDELIEKNKSFDINPFLKFNYLNLSIYFSRDEREFDIHNYSLLKSLILKKENFILKTHKNRKLISGYEQYFKLFKETKYLPNKKLPLVIFQDLLKLGIQLIDIIFITLIIFFSNLITIFLSNKKYINLENKKIYSIYY